MRIFLFTNFELVSTLTSVKSFVEDFYLLSLTDLLSILDICAALYNMKYHRLFITEF